MLFVGVLIGMLSLSANAADKKTLADVLSALKATEAEVGKLWNASVSLDQNVTKLEHTTSGVMANETNVSTQLLHLEFMTRWNNRTLHHLSYQSTQLLADLDFERYDLQTTDTAKKDTSTAAKTLAAKANATVTKANLTKLEEIGAKLWRVSDPSSGASLDKTEAKLKAMDVEIKYVRDKLDPVIKDRFKQKMRSHLDRWKQDNLELGKVALEQSGELSKYYLKPDRGADDDPDSPQWPLDNDGSDVSGDEWFLQTSAGIGRDLQSLRRMGFLRMSH